METEFRYFFKYLKEKVGFEKNALQGDTKYFFLHIPKTAGTSFLFTLYNYFPYRNIYPKFDNYLNPKVKSYLNGKMFQEKRLEIINSDVKILAGHLPFRYHKEYGDDVKILTFFREPLDRLYSDLVYLKAHSLNHKDKTYEEILNANNESLYRKQATLLGYNYKRGNIDVAIKNLKSCDFIGITEEYEKSIRLCNKIFGWALRPDVSKNKYDGDKSKVRAQIRPLINESKLTADFQIYQAAKLRFEELCGQFEID